MKVKSGKRYFPNFKEKDMKDQWPYIKALNLFIFLVIFIFDDNQITLSAKNGMGP